MSDPHVMITGASSGLGAELAARFRKQRWNVTGTTHEIKSTFGTDLMLYDATAYGAPNALVTSMMGLEGRAKGPVNVLINNAGINAIRRFEDLTLEFMEEVMRVNCHAPVLLIKELLGAQLFAPQPVIVNVISDAAWRPMRHSAAYGQSKAAFDMATRQMARELTKPHDLIMVGIRPGKMKGTGMSTYIDQQVCDLRGWTPEEAHAYFVQNSVTGREQSPHDVARLIYDLVENPLITTMSGACIDLVG